jgi:DNA-binding SARP family transcriptional activator/Tfp pilus assembly protein PilF
MEFCLLGPMLVRCGGEVIPIPPGKQRAVLAALLLDAGRVVTLDGLAEVLWGPQPPPSARVTVQNYVKRLRKALPARIATYPHGYLISVDAGELDVSRFEALLASARAAAGDGRWDSAGAQARAALELWRGEPLADVGSEFLAAREVPRLAELRLQALEARLDADLHLGHHVAAIAELRRLVVAHPPREHLHALLMLALYRDGRQAEALAAYQAARRVLVDEFGLEPGAELREVNQRILAGDPSPEAAPPAPPRQLPAPVAHFAGRAGELDRLTTLLEPGRPGPRMVVISAISGTAGVGKTALAVHWAHRVAGRFPDGQLYADLRGFDPTGAPAAPEAVIRRFLGALGVPADRIPPAPGVREDLYRSMLADKQMLIVLDNAGDAGQVRPLLPGGPGCVVVVTSRCQLTGLVATEGAQPLALDLLTEADARELLARRLGEERIAAEPDAVTELTWRCARLPLALAIVAARAALDPDLPLARLAADLTGRLDAFDTGEAASSLRPVLSWSYQMLSRPAARMFRLLSVHHGPDISLPAAASLAAVPTDEARRLLGELARANLLSSHRRGRFSFHDLLRAYAAERAGAEEDEAAREAAGRRVLDHYLHAAYAADRRLAPDREPVDLGAPRDGVVPEEPADYDQALAWFRAEHQVLLAATALAGRAGHDAYAWQIPWSLVNFFDLEGHWHDAAAVQRTALAAAGRLGDRAGQARAHYGLSGALLQAGSPEGARAQLEHALRLCADLGDQVGQARVSLDLARVTEALGDTNTALHRAQQALSLLRAAGHRAGQGRALNSVGWYHAHLGDHEQALALCTQAVRLCRELDDRLGEAAAWDSLGYIHRRQGRYPDAIACLQRAIELTRQLGGRYHQADALTHLGDAHREAGSPREARHAWRQALDILDDLGHPDAEKVRAKIHAAETVSRLPR